MIDLEIKLTEKTYLALQHAAHRAQKSEAEVAVTAIQSYLA